MAPRDHKAKKVIRVIKATKVLPVQLDHKVQPEPMVLPDQWDLPAQSDLKDHKVPPELMERRVLLVQWDLPDQLVHKDRRVLKESKGFQVNQVKMQQ